MAISLSNNDFRITFFRRQILIVLIVIQGSVNLYSTTIRIPFRYVQSFIILDFKLENLLPVKLIFDTGAEHNLLFHKNSTDLIQGSYQRELKIMGSDLKREIPALLTHELSVQVNPRFFINEQFLVLMEPSESLNEIIGEKVDGILSAGTFRNYIIEINYKRKFILLTDRNQLEKKTKNYKSCDIQLFRGKPFLKSEFEINPDSASHYSLNLLLDTGAGLSLLIYRSAQSTLAIPDKIITFMLCSGIGGLLEGFIGKAKKLTFCSTEFTDVITNYQEISEDYALKEGQTKQGLIGNHILEKFNFILDYSSSKIYLKAISNNPVVNYDRSGLSVIAGGANLNRYYIAYVIPGSPADSAGIKSGDRIKSINGRSSAFLSLSSIQKRLTRNPGNKIRLNLQRGKEKIVSKIVLRDLL